MARRKTTRTEETRCSIERRWIFFSIAHRRCLGQSPQKRETETENKGIRNRKRRKKWQKNLRSKLTGSDKGYMRIKEKGKMTKYTVEKKGHP
ncbi:hypothetical protein B5E43_08335 [Flavonifractor sp. An100]|nr:hypothetical protein B5E43_08335 [Flavonifractor sp. An100]